ncbi:MAG TPA: hypothetical protein VK995_03225, partial [Oceanipulchritudo sp.]|nr:hypothetical protein [Oceanipulchritudo sp.]
MKSTKILMLGALASMFSLTAVADWTLIQDFETATYETFDLNKRFSPQGDIYLEALDPVNPSNRFYYADPGPQVDGQNNQIWNAITLPTPVAEGAKATIKYDIFFYEVGPFNFNIGLSDVAVQLDTALTKENGQMLVPNNYGDFESQMGLTGLGIFTVRNGNGFTNTTVQYPVGEWFTIYHVIDNGQDRTQFYYKTAAMETPQIIALPDGTTSAIFRNGTDQDLITWIFVSAGSNAGPINVYMLDNMYIDTTGVNLDGGTPV